MFLHLNPLNKVEGIDDFLKKIILRISAQLVYVELFFLRAKIMRLTSEETQVLNGTKGQTLKKCLQTLVNYGDFYGASKFVPISSAHIAMSGGSTLFGTYLDIFSKLVSEGFKFKVPTTINPRYMTERPNFLERFVFKRQSELEQNFKAMGGIENYSCAPYFGENLPKRGDILAWAESNAIVYINSIIGAKTNRTSRVMDLFCAVLGMTPEFGLLIDENRKADCEIIIDVKEKTDHALLGYLIGEKLTDKIPFIRGLKGTNDDFKNMGGAMAASGGLAMYHIENTTPEAKDMKEGALKPNHSKMTITDEMLNELKLRLSKERRKTNLVFIGCPHLSFNEVVHVSKLIEDKKAVKKLWINTSPSVIQDFKMSEHFPTFSKTGAQLVSICPYTLFNSPSIKKRWILNNSGKMRHYSPIYYGSLDECLKEAIGGVINAI